MQQPIGNVGPKDWGDAPVFIVGGGPSLIPYRSKLTEIQNRGHVLAINDSFKHCYPEVIFSIDHTWLSKRLGEIPGMLAPVFVAVEDNLVRKECPNLTYLLRRYRSGSNDVSFLSENPAEITNGMNSGFGALNFAYLRGAKIIYLLGFDFKDAPDGQTHFHGSYEWHNKTNSNLLYPRWAKVFEDTIPQLKSSGAHVFNGSADSLLTAFPHKSYEDIFNGI